LALRIIDRFCVAVAAGAGLCGAALALSPGAVATPLRTGGGNCIEQQMGFAAGPVAAAPVVLPGPVPIAPAVPVVPVVPPVPPVPVVPPVAPVVPVAGAGAGAAEGAGVAAPIATQAGTGKGAPMTPSSGKAADPVVLPGPQAPAPQAVAVEVPSAPIPAVLAGTTTALPACGAVGAPAQ